MESDTKGRTDLHGTVFWCIFLHVDENAPSVPSIRLFTKFEVAKATARAILDANKDENKATRETLDSAKSHLPVAIQMSRGSLWIFPTMVEGAA